jgi:hypothetical protein
MILPTERMIFFRIRKGWGSRNRARREVRRRPLRGTKLILTLSPRASRKLSFGDEVLSSLLRSWPSCQALFETYREGFEPRRKSLEPNSLRETGGTLEDRERRPLLLSEILLSRRDRDRQDGYLCLFVSNEELKTQ